MSSVNVEKFKPSVGWVGVEGEHTIRTVTNEEVYFHLNLPLHFLVKSGLYRWGDRLLSLLIIMGQ